jgi:hypothetical protein
MGVLSVPSGLRRLVRTVSAAAVIAATGFAGLVVTEAPADAAPTPTNVTVCLGGGTPTPSGCTSSTPGVAKETTSYDIGFTTPVELTSSNWLIFDSTWALPTYQFDFRLADLTKGVYCTGPAVDVFDRYTVQVTVPASCAGTATDFYALRITTVHNPTTAGTYTVTVGATDLSAGYGTYKVVSPPSPPRTLAATPSNGTVHLAWTPPSTDGGSTIRGYDVYMATSSGHETTPLAVFIPTTSYTASGLTNGTTYYFTVKAENTTGQSTPSNEVSAKPATTPGPPTTLSAAGAYQKVTLTWTAPATDGGTTVEGYDVYEGTSPGGESSTPANGTTLVTGTTYTVTGLTGSTPSYFTVKAVNGLGSSTASTEASATPTTTVPSAPTGLSATPGPGKVTLQWTAPGTSGDGTVLGYDVYEGTSTGGEATAPVNGSTPVTGTSYTVTGLANGTTYWFTVKAVNAKGSSAASGQATATPATVPGPPTGLTAKAGQGQVTLTWTAPATDGGSAVTGYDVYQSTSKGGEATPPVNGTTPIPATTTSYTATGLANGTTYWFTVKAVNAAGRSPASNEVQATPAATTPTPPRTVRASAGAGSVALTWTAPATDGGSAVKGYDVYEGTSSGGESSTPVNGTTLVTGTSYTAKGLANGTTYWFTVKTVGGGQRDRVPGVQRRRRPDVVRALVHHRLDIVAGR